MGIEPDPQDNITLFIVRAPNDAAMAIEPGQGLTIAAEQCDIVVQYHEALHYPTWIRADCARSSQPNFRIFLRGFSAD